MTLFDPNHGCVDKSVLFKPRRRYKLVRGSIAGTGPIPTAPLVNDLFGMSSSTSLGTSMDYDDDDDLIDFGLKGPTTFLCNKLK